MTNSIASTTSLKNKPTLRWTLVGLWTLVVIYSTIIFIQAIPAFFSLIPQEGDAPLANLDSVLISLFNLGIDLLMIVGFLLIAFGLFFQRSDDWFTIFTSMFMIVFAGRISSVINNIAVMPGFESKAGLLIALGDIGVVLFILLFPNGKFSPHWMKYFVPFLILTMLGIYIFPNIPTFWKKMDQGVYLVITSAWYLLGFASFLHRYVRTAGVHQKQQMRWVMIGTLAPFLWFLLYNISIMAFANTIHASILSYSLFQILSRVSSIFLFLIMPLFVALAISRSNLFDIDLFIHRSLIYGGLTGALGLTFAIILGAISILFRTFQPGDQSMLAMTISAVAAGAFFQPARKRLQNLVDRTFYNIQIEYDTVTEPLEKWEVPPSEITLSNYKNMTLIGRGGMANVYRGENPTTGQIVAIKVLPAELSEDAQFRKRFMREAETVSSLSHSNIVRIVNYGDENGTFYIAMEFLTGPDLRNLLKAQECIDLSESLVLLHEIASALDYAHQRGFVHRDIKPSNVMLDSKIQPTRAVLTDFGIAKITGANTRITVSGVLGTFDYIAPEQIQSSGEVDGRADIYALGVMTYQMLTGYVPFKRSNAGALLLAHLTTPPPDAREVAPEISGQTARSIQKAMAKKPNERFETATEFVSALGGI